jgi:hypothetical protein
VENEAQTVTLDDVQKLAADLRVEIGKAIIGQNGTIQLMLIALLSGGLKAYQARPKHCWRNPWQPP